jgi:DNA end-binding protein Ku
MQTVWKGAVSFGLVNVPVKMFSATKDNDIPMKMLHKKYNEPIRYSRTCPKCDSDVEWSDIVKGYEYEPGHFVTFEKDELEAISSENSREIRILDFVDLEEIDPIYYQKTYYLGPGDTGSRAYKLLIKALESTNKIGIANVTIRSKSSLAAIRVVDGVLSMVTMFYNEEVRPISQIPNLPEDEKVDDRELEMAQMLIGQLAAPFEPGKYEDEYKARLQEAIERKVQGKDIKVAPEEKPTNVIDLMEALKASLSQTGGAQPPAAAAKRSSTSKKTASKSRAAPEAASDKAKGKGKTTEKPAAGNKKPAPAKRPKKTGA